MEEAWLSLPSPSVVQVNRGTHLDMAVPQSASLPLTAAWAVCSQLVQRQQELWQPSGGGDRAANTGTAGKQSLSQVQHQGKQGKRGFPVVVAVSSGSAADQSCHLGQIPLDAAFPSFVPGTQLGGGCVVPSVCTASPCRSREGLPAHPSSW